MASDDKDKAVRMRGKEARQGVELEEMVLCGLGM